MNSNDEIIRKDDLKLSELMFEFKEVIIKDKVYEFELECYDSEINLPNLRFIL